MDIISFIQYCESSRNKSDLLLKNNQNIWIEFFPSAKFDCIPPSNLSFNPDAELFLNSPIPHLFNLVHEAGQVGLASLADVSLVTPHGLLFDNDSRLMADSYHNKEMIKIPLREVQSMLSAGLHTNGPQRVVDKPAILLLGPWSWIYHHWLIEDLTRLWVFDYFPELKNYPLVVPGNLLDFHKASLDAFGINIQNVIPYDGSNWIFRRLLVPTFLAPGGHSRRQINWLRRNFFRAFDIKHRNIGKRRLFISRNDVETRQILNEREVIDFLQNYNFEVILSSKLSLSEQIETFSDAEIICGSSGSGLTNHIFAPKSATLIEIQPDTYINRVHWFSSNLCCQKYMFIIGHGETDQHDYVVSLSKLKLAIDMAIGKEFSN